MMRPLRCLAGCLWVALLLGPAAAWAQTTAIAHDPIPFALRGQPLTLKAKVTGSADIENVTLYYALFRDAAPFRVAMKSTGLNYYVGTIDAGLLTGVESISYYIEAQDKSGALTETPWYDVTFRKPDAKTAPAGTAVMPTPGPAAPAPVIPVSSAAGSAPEKQGSWKTPVLIAGGAAVLLGGAYALSDSGGGSDKPEEDEDDDDDNGGGDDDGGGATTNDPSGTYAGTVTTCFTPEGGAAACESMAMQFVVDDQGIVFSETIYPGQQLTDLLDASQGFTLTATVDQGGTNGAVNFEGAVVGSKILGSVSGTATTPDGQGAYSGSFSANKQ
jgi:hypothetical protein